MSDDQAQKKEESQGILISLKNVLKAIGDFDHATASHDPYLKNELGAIKDKVQGLISKKEKETK